MKGRSAIELAAIALAVAGCHARDVEPPLTLSTTTPVTWSSMPSAIVPVGSGGVLLDGAGVHEIADGAVGAVIDATARTWTASTPYADTTATVTGLAADSDGEVLGFTPSGLVIDQSERYALGGHAVRALAAMSPGAFVAAASDGVFVVSGADVVRYPASDPTAVGGGGNVAAWRNGDVVTRLDLTSIKLTQANVPYAREIAVGSSGDVYVASGHTLYRWSGKSIAELHVFADPVRDLRGFGGVVWFAVGPRVGSVDGATIALTDELSEGDDVRVWLKLEGDGGWVAKPDGLVEFAQNNDTPEGTWTAEIEPIFTAHCAKCHTGGSYDLHTYDRWNALRDIIHTRLIIDKTMPPMGEPTLSADEIATIASWLSTP